MEITDAVLVRNPYGVEVWVDRARLPALLAQGYQVVHDPRAERAQGGARKRRKRKDNSEERQ